MFHINPCQFQTFWWCCAPRKAPLAAFCLGDSIAFPAPQVHGEAVGSVWLCLFLTHNPVVGVCQAGDQVGVWNETLFELLNSACVLGVLDLWELISLKKKAHHGLWGCSVKSVAKKPCKEPNTRARPAPPCLQLWLKARGAARKRAWRGQKNKKCWLSHGFGSLIGEGL